jgi:hypothetical protein
MMRASRRRRRAVGTIGAIVVSALATAQTVVNFDAVNELPSDWLAGVTGKGAAKWIVAEDKTAPSPPKVLRQSGEATFCWAVKKNESIQDGFAQVQFKPLEGREDQAGGLVFRFKDANNYYVVRANGLEDNVVLYKTVNGKRSSLQVKGRMLGYGMDVDVPKGRWSSLRVDFEGKLFTVTYNGKRLFEVEDETFVGAGTVGVWTKADSVTAFDDFTFGKKDPR